MRRVLAGLPAAEYHAVVYEWPLSRLLVWIEAAAINHEIESLKQAARSG
ncbi:MAG: hypothetical protein IAE99_07870 [Rhodothermales bacterium]|nr:hypothetical protein [Rhodothermales bacterium]